MERMDSYSKEVSKVSNCDCSKASSLYAAFPNSITLTATVAGGATTTGLYMGDFVGLISTVIGVGANDASFDIAGVVTVENVQKFLATHRGRVSLINYQCLEDANQLNNKIKFLTASIDESEGTAKIFDVATDRRNTQFEAGLITVYPKKGDAWMTNTTSVKVATSALPADAKTVSLTLQFDAWEAYTDIIA